MKEKIRTYYVKFAVDTIHTEAEIKAYSKTEAKSLLEKQYANCKIKINSDIEDVTKEKEEKDESKDGEMSENQ